MNPAGSEERSRRPLDGRKGLVVGIANRDSIAWGCALACRRAGDILDVGATAAFLVSDAARALTGDTISVDGGRHVMA